MRVERQTDVQILSSGLEPVMQWLAAPSPHAGEGREGGASAIGRLPPTPIPSPPGGGEAPDVSANPHLIRASAC
jgi:hypothetical protein